MFILCIYNFVSHYMSLTSTFHLGSRRVVLEKLTGMLYKYIIIYYTYQLGVFNLSRELATYYLIGL